MPVGAVAAAAAAAAIYSSLPSGGARHRLNLLSGRMLPETTEEHRVDGALT